MIPLPFSRRPALVGVVHLGPTPGAPGAGAFAAVLERAVADARALEAGGCDAVIVENFGDAPFYPGAVPPETVASLTLAVARVRASIELPVGVNVLRNDARAALGICAATGAEFLRVNVHTGAAATDQGLIEGRAAETLRERARLGLEVALLADVHVKHATPLGATSLADSARETVGRGLADGVLVTGSATGAAPDAATVAEVRAAVGAAPVLVASGVTVANAAELLAGADGAIVGTALKRGGEVHQPVDPERVRALRAVLGY
ncbi:MAG: BtpA/SgcQ family protein [Planctomycetota bacterium]|nr:BtpA/SgcQ family protein [Planctomycetota bacterium]